MRYRMVSEQLEFRGIHDQRILNVFREIPRHLFVSNVPIHLAYGDTPLPISAGQTISQPYIVALMLVYLDLKKQHKVLEIGSGSGYATALLSKLCHHVDAVEVYQELIDGARQAVEKLSIENVSFIHRSAWEQIVETDGYDRIILWASPPRVPEHLLESLNLGGILVTPEGKNDQYVWIYKRQVGKIEKIKRDAVRFVPLVKGTVSEIDGIMRG